MIALLGAFATVVAVTLLVAGLIRLAFVPFSLSYEVRHRGRRDDRAPVTDRTIFDEPPFVTVVVPAYNEGVVIENCLRSIVRSDYGAYEVIAVDDGSSDDTYARMCAIAAESPRITAVSQENAGKGAALNTGIARARGTVVMLVDADGLFQPYTITRMLRGFTDDGVGAVCGNDRPVMVSFSGTLVRLPDGTTSSRLQWLRVPTSMYSISRTVTSLPRKCSSRSSTVWSLRPRCTTVLTLTGLSPDSSAASMPSSTCARPP